MKARPIEQPTPLQPGRPSNLGLPGRLLVYAGVLPAEDNQ